MEKQILFFLTLLFLLFTNNLQAQVFAYIDAVDANTDIRWGDIPGAGLQENFPIRNNLDCTCPQPAYQGRSEWCPQGDCQANPNPTSTDVTHLIVHHSGGTNSSSDWVAVVRSLWDFHVNTYGWSDIGFNWLIDPNGVIYEGRGDNIVGSAFCATNFGVMSVCLLGDFDLVEPSEAAKSALVELLAWKACDSNINPLGASFHASSGLTLDNIAGHRDGCDVSSPGDLLYQQLPTIRSQVSDYIDIECSTVSIDNELFNPSSVKIFPNPSRKEVAVYIANDLLGVIHFQLFDLQGKMLDNLLTVEKRTTEQTFFLHTNSLRPGTYMLQVSHEQGMGMFKIVKQ